jgi:hypothetical protein
MESVYGLTTSADTTELYSKSMPTKMCHLVSQDSHLVDVLGDGVAAFPHGGEGDMCVDTASARSERVHALNDTPCQSQSGVDGPLSHDLSGQG